MHKLNLLPKAIFVTFGDKLTFGLKFIIPSLQAYFVNLFCVGVIRMLRLLRDNKKARAVGHVGYRVLHFEWHSLANYCFVYLPISK
jgi:hypothetical protein